MSFFIVVIWSAWRDNNELKLKERLIAGILPRDFNMNRGISNTLSGIRYRLSLTDSAALVSQKKRRRTLGLKTAQLARQKRASLAAGASCEKLHASRSFINRREEALFGRQDTVDVFGEQVGALDVLDARRLRGIQRDICALTSTTGQAVSSVGRRVGRVDKMLAKAGDFVSEQMAAVLVKDVDDRLAAETEAAPPSSRAKALLDKELALQLTTAGGSKQGAESSAEGAGDGQVLQPPIVGGGSLQRLRHEVWLMHELRRIKRQDLREAKQELKRMDLRAIMGAMRGLQGEQPTESLKGVVVRTTSSTALVAGRSRDRLGAGTAPETVDALAGRRGNMKSMKMKKMIAALKAAEVAEAAKTADAAETAETVDAAEVAEGGGGVDGGGPPAAAEAIVSAPSATRSVSWTLAAQPENETPTMVVVVPTERVSEVIDHLSSRRSSSSGGSHTSRWAKHSDSIHAMGEHSVLLTEWQKEARSIAVRLRLAFYKSHTLMAPLFFNGVEGFTRAQTSMFLFNTLALEIVVLSMQFSPPEDGPVVINPVQIAASALLAAAICIPAAWVFAVLFEPVALLRFFNKLLLLPICWPFWLRTFVRERVKAAGVEKV